MIKQFLTDVVWEDLDYLIIDTPPGKALMKSITLSVPQATCGENPSTVY